MFSNRKSIKEVNKIQERYLRLVINNYELSSKEHLHLTNEISLQQRCLNSVMILCMCTYSFETQAQYSTL